MPSRVTKPLEHLRVAQPACSLIKPHLRNLSGSGTRLDGIIVERDVEQPNSGIYRPTGPTHRRGAFGPSCHVGMAHEWTARGGVLFRWGGPHQSGRAVCGTLWSRAVELLLMAINPGFVNRVATEMDAGGHVELAPRFHFQDALLEQLARSLVAEFEQASPPDRLYADSLTHTLIVHLIKKYSSARVRPRTTKQGLPQRSLARVVEFIDVHLGEDLSLRQIAEIAEMSPSHFLTLFKQSTGLAAHRYLVEKRIEKARVLLLQTKLQIADIATQTGFADQSHLTRLMRRYLGLTPRQVRST